MKPCALFVAKFCLECKVEFTPAKQGSVYALAGQNSPMAAGQAVNWRESSLFLCWDGSSSIYLTYRRRC